MFGGKSIGVARYGVPGAALGLALVWLVGARDPLARAQLAGPNGEPPLTHPQPSPRALDSGSGRIPPPRAVASGASDGTISMVMPSNNGSAHWIYLIDTKTHQLAVYKMDTANNTASLKLEAARHYQWDLKLDRYNNSGLEPAEIEKQVKSLVQQARH